MRFNFVSPKTLFTVSCILVALSSLLPVFLILSDNIAIPPLGTRIQVILGFLIHVFLDGVGITNTPAFIPVFTLLFMLSTTAIFALPSYVVLVVGKQLLSNWLTSMFIGGWCCVFLWLFFATPIGYFSD